MGDPLDHPKQEGTQPMSATAQTRNPRRFRLAGNHNETIVEDELDTEGHRLASNDNETVVEDELDTEGHRLSSNDNETIVDGMRRVDPADGDENPVPLGARRLRR
jgi:hypothetical protein